MIKREGILLGQLFKKLAPRVGATVLLEPEWNIAGRITFKNGKRRYFRFNAVDLNPIGSAKVASDKDYANFFMRKLGFPVVEGKIFLRPDFADTLGIRKLDRAHAYQYAKQLGFPVIVKPNGGSQGTGVFLVHNKRDLNRALSFIFMHDRIALVQRHMLGKDFRIVVLDDRVISAYERIPLSVIGDGVSTIGGLLDKKNRQFTARGRDTQIQKTDPRILHKLSRQKLSLRSVLKRGQQVYLLDNANLSSGGDSLDVTDTLHPGFKKIAIDLTRGMGLRFSGVDLIVEGDISEKPKRYHVLEINDTPGLDHYAASGKKQRKIVEDLYLQVLESLAR